MLPDFLVVGAQKAGTSSLHSYLETHPSINLPPGKETKFFADDSRYARGLDYYQSHWLPGGGAGQLTGEVDPDYMYFEVALERMAETLDIENTRFIFVFREPVSRAFSHYLMSYRRGIEPLGFEEAVAREPERLRKGFYERLHYSYIDRGYYHRQVSRFLERVDRQQMLFVLSEDLAERNTQVMAGIFRFLEVDDWKSPVFQQKFLPAKVPKSMELLHAVKSDGLHKRLVRTLLPFPALRKRLRQRVLEWNEKEAVDVILRDDTREQLKALYIEENRKLSDLISRDLTHWS